MQQVKRLIKGTGMNGSGGRIDDAHIFRKEAIERRARQEQLDVSLALSASRRWIALGSAVFFGIAGLLGLYLLTR